MNYKQLLILKLSDTIEWKNEREMIIPKEMRKGFDWSNTCEFLGGGKYILRCYYKGGQLYWKREYQNGQRHGLSFGWWWRNGQSAWKAEYQNGLRHVFNFGWYSDGRSMWKEEYQNGKLIKRHL